MIEAYARRYARHLVLPEIGKEGQKKLAQKSALVVGAGGLGAASIGYLAAMGIGRIGIIDDDRVELSNLQRQTLYETGDIGRLKVEAAKDRVEEINPECAVEIYANRFPATAPSVFRGEEAIIRHYDLILDGSDNFATRFAVHEACFSARKPLISAAISGFSGQISTFKAYLGEPHPCYRCFVPDMPQREISCAQEGIVGALAGVVGSMQALETVKELLGIGQSLSGWLLQYDALAAGFRRSRILPNPNCAHCH